MAEFQLDMMGSLARFEHDLIQQRQDDGVTAAKKRGAHKGRPRTLDIKQIRSVRNAALAGTPKVQIGRDHAISRTTLYRHLEAPTL